MKIFLRNINNLFTSSVGILLRHAEKEPIPLGTFGNNVKLTPYGRKNCKILNSLLSNFIVGIETSPVERCIETAVLLSSNIDRKNIKTTTLLGNPGIFVVDPLYAQDYFIQYSLLHIVRHLLSSSPNPPGFCLSTFDAIKNLMNYMLNIMETTETTHNQTALKLFVTHDSILAAVLGYFFPNIPLEDLWPNYLEGLIFWKNKNQLMLNYRKIQRTILW